MISFATVVLISITLLFIWLVLPIGVILAFVCFGAFVAAFVHDVNLFMVWWMTFLYLIMHRHHPAYRRDFELDTCSISGYYWISLENGLISEFQHIADNMCSVKCMRFDSEMVDMANKHLKAKREEFKNILSMSLFGEQAVAQNALEEFEEKINVQVSQRKS